MQYVYMTQGVLGVRQPNGVDQIHPQPTLVATAANRFYSKT